MTTQKIYYCHIIVHLCMYPIGLKKVFRGEKTKRKRMYGSGTCVPSGMDCYIAGLIHYLLRSCMYIHM